MHCEGQARPEAVSPMQNGEGSLTDCLMGGVGGKFVTQSQ